jgi:hypothetical protein
LVAVTAAHIDPHSDGSALLFIPSSKTDQEGQGAWGWLSADTMRRVGAWLVASAITKGPVFRRVGVDRRRLRAAVAPMAYEAIPGHTRHWQEKLRGKKAEPARAVYTVGTASLSRQGVNGIYLTQDLFAAGEDGVGIAQALRWSSPSTALRYGRKLAARSNVAARVLSKIRG